MKKHLTSTRKPIIYPSWKLLLTTAVVSSRGAETYNGEAEL